MKECEEKKENNKKQPEKDVERRRRKTTYKGPNGIVYSSFIDFRISLRTRILERFPKTVENLIRYCNQNNCKLIVLNLEDPTDTTFLSDFEIPNGELSFDF